MNSCPDVILREKRERTAQMRRKGTVDGVLLPWLRGSGRGCATLNGPKAPLVSVMRSGEEVCQRVNNALCGIGCGLVRCEIGPEVRKMLE